MGSGGLNVKVGDVWVRWRFLHDQVKSVHALTGEEPTGVEAALCGLTPAWWRADRRWRGVDGEDAARAQELPRCCRCEASLRKLAADASNRPVFDPQVAEVYEWMRANGVDEWLPEQLRLLVSGQQLTYTSYLWQGPRGWNSSYIGRDHRGDAAVEARTLGLRRPVTERLRVLAKSGLFTLLEENGR